MDKETLHHGLKVFWKSHGLDTAFGDIRKNLSEQDRNLIMRITNKLRYQITAMDLLASAHGLSYDEKTGLILFVGLVNITDDLLDNPEGPHSQDPHELEDMLLRCPAVVKGKPLLIDGKKATVRDLKEYTTGKFSTGKQETIKSFLNHALNIESQIGSKKPGHYSAADAIKYRQETSEQYYRTGLLLANITDQNVLTERLLMGNAIQWVDDVMDCFSDFNERAMNPVIAYAYEMGEGDMLARLADQSRSSILPSPIFAKLHFRELPNTRERVKETYNTLAGSSDFLHVLENLVM